MSGGAAGARAGTISLMFGGPAAVLEAHRAVFDAFAGNVFHVGEPRGQGQAMKLLNNFLSATALAATSEALAFGAAHGLDLATMIDVLNVSTGRNSATVDKFPEPRAHRHLRRRLPHRAHGQGRPPLRRDGRALRHGQGGRHGGVGGVAGRRCDDAGHRLHRDLEAHQQEGSRDDLWTLVLLVHTASPAMRNTRIRA